MSIVFACVSRVHLETAEHCISMCHSCSVKDCRALFPCYVQLEITEHCFLVGHVELEITEHRFLVGYARLEITEHCFVVGHVQLEIAEHCF